MKRSEVDKIIRLIYENPNGKPEAIYIPHKDYKSLRHELYNMSKFNIFDQPPTERHILTVGQVYVFPIRIF